MPLNRLAFKVELARRGLSQRAVAIRLGYKQSTFSERVLGVKPATQEFLRALEKELGLKKGALEEKAPSPAPRRTSGVK